MKRFLLTFAVVCLAVVVLGRWYAYRQLLAERRAEAAQREAVERALAKVISTDAFAGEETTLEEALRGVAGQCDVPLRVDRRAVWSRQAPIGLPRGDFTIEQLLDRLTQVGWLGWCRHGDGILVTSTARADKGNQPFTEVYPLPAGMGRGETVSDDAEALCELIASYFEPDSWDEVGGEGVIRPAGGAIVLHHRPEFHRRVQALLSNLQSPPADSRQAFSPEHWPASDERRIIAALGEKGSIDFDDQPLDHVVSVLAARHGIKIVLAQTTLADAAIPPDTPITKKLANVSLRTILREILADLKLTYVVRDDVIQITTPEDGESVLVNRLYDVHDLAADSGARTFTDLIDLITTTIEPDSWDEVGGPGVIVSLGQRWLVVTQTQQIHEQIEPLLIQLRQFLRADGPGEVLISPPQNLSPEVERALDREVTLAFRDQPLQEVCDWLSDLLHVPVLLSKAPLEEAAVNGDTPVTADLPPLPLRHALKIMLGDMVLAFRTRGEVIHITTHDDVEGDLDIRLFDVRHLTSPGAGGIDERTLAHLIRTGIRPADWDENGGPGSLSFFRGLLVVAQTDEVQQEVRHLIDALSERLLPQSRDDVPPSFWIGRSRGEEEILSRLGERDSLQVVNPDTEETVRLLCARHSIPVIFKKSCGESADEPRRDAALDFSGAPLHEILAKLLAEKRAGFIAWNGLLVITDAETAESQYRAKMYPVGSRWPGDQKLRGQDVAKLLAKHVEPDSWEDAGGPGYAMPVNAEWLHVVQSLDVHRQIDEAIAAMRSERHSPEPK